MKKTLSSCIIFLILTAVALGPLNLILPNVHGHAVGVSLSALTSAPPAIDGTIGMDTEPDYPFKEVFENDLLDIIRSIPEIEGIQVVSVNTAIQAVLIRISYTSGLSDADKVALQFSVESQLELKSYIRYVEPNFIVCIPEDPDCPPWPGFVIGELIVGFISAMQADIDIKPGSDPNSINVKSAGVIPVAILTTPSFDATSVDRFNVRFGRTGTEARYVLSHLEDVDGDGDVDVITHFSVQDTGIQAGDTQAALSGYYCTAIDCFPFIAFDTIRAFFPGDANSDLMVNVLDLALVGRAFGSTSESQNWNLYADFNEDNTINILDLVVVGQYFGQHA